MSTTFTEFLREQAAKREAEAKAGKAAIDEWRAAVERLLAQIRGWLAESDPDGIIQIKDGEQELREPGLGRYRVPRLDLRALDKWIGIIPKARLTVGTAKPPRKDAPERAEGRVDITDELRRYVLYRFRQDGGDLWLIDDLRSEPKPLTHELLEAALMSYLYEDAR
jgi:hypothetical protein